LFLGGPGSSDSGVGDSTETAVERVHRLISELGESVATVDEINERVSNELDWRRLHSQSRQVLKWIGQCELILCQTAVIPTSLAEAESMQTDHDKFQPVLNDAHPEAVQCAARASYLLQSVAADHPRRGDFQKVAETVAERWQKLVYAAEEKHKLLIAATNWYKTSEQVISVLRSLEKDYRREEDWCRSDKALNSGNVESYLNDLLNKHGEQKEAFLKACILARRTSELFMKYLHRQPPNTACRVKVEERIRADIADLMTKEQAVLEAWAAQRRRFEECVKFVTVENEMLDLVRCILQSFGVPIKSTEDWNLALPALGKQSPLFLNVKRACQTLKSLVDTGIGAHHAVRLAKMCNRLNACIAPTEPSRPPESESVASASAGAVPATTSTTTKMRSTSTGSNRTSVSSTGSTAIASSTDTTPSISSAVGLTEEQRKMINRRQNILRELVTTERAYVMALRTCLETFYVGTMNPPADIPFPSRVSCAVRWKLNTKTSKPFKMRRRSYWLPRYVTITDRHPVDLRQPLAKRARSVSVSLNTASQLTLHLLQIVQAQGRNEISVAAHQIVQLIQRTAQPSMESLASQPPTPTVENPEDETSASALPWAFVRFVVTGSAASPNAPVDEGFIPARLIGAPVYPRSSSVSAGANSGGRRSMRRWLPTAGASSAKDRRQLPGAGKRSSKADMAPPIPIINRVRATTAQQTAIAASGTTQDSTVLLDNVSEESVELELPPPMVELQALPTTSAVSVENEMDETKKPEDEGTNGGPPHLSSRSPSTLNISTMGCGELQSANSELNLSRMVEAAGEGEDGAGQCLPPVLTGVPSDLQQNALGSLRLHGALRIATQLVGALEASLADLTISDGNGGLRTPVYSSTAAQDEELLKAIAEDSTTLCFVNRHLLLFDQGLVIADAAVEGPSRSDGGATRQMKCQFRHYLSFSQIAVLEDISVAGSRPTEEQVLWFCVSERPRRSTVVSSGNGLMMGGADGGLQSHLCHVLAPHSPEIRVRWLSELNTALEQSKIRAAVGSTVNNTTTSGDEGGFHGLSQDLLSCLPRSISGRFDLFQVRE
uniref:DH domain-containing protein n=1 Tax=Rodentolepis nana TaxID=102285 RepID=A0A0R3TRV9_RODNA